MDYKIVNRQITLLDNKYWILSGELNKFRIDDINFILHDMEKIFKGKYGASSFSGQHMAIVDFDKRIAKISYFDELIGEELSIDIYNMLKDYRDKLIEYENE